MTVKDKESSKIQFNCNYKAIDCRLSDTVIDAEGCFFGDFFISRPPKRNISSKDYVTFLSMNDVSEHGGILRQQLIRASEVKAGLTSFERFDVLIAKITPCFENGKGACLDQLKTITGFGSTEFHVLRAKPQGVPRYIYYHTRLLNFRKQLEREMIGSAGQKRVPLKAIENYRIPVKHSYQEQRDIATALCDIDSLINSLNQLITKKRNIKLAAMQQLLTGKQRLPGFGEDWTVVPFGSIAKLRKEKTDLSSNENHIFCIELEHISQGTGILEGHTFTTGKSSIKSCFCKGDVLFGKLRAYLRKYWLADRNGVASTEIWPIIPNLKSSIPEYIFYIVQTDSFIEAASLAYGTHMPRSEWNKLITLKIPLPTISQQHAIVKVLSDMDAEILAIEQQLAKARNLKQGMMQELLTGRIRLI